MLFKKKNKKQDIEQDIVIVEGLLFNVIEKCRYYLKDEYHLCVKYNGTIFPKYALFKKYDNDWNKYFDDSNKSILSTSKGSTLQDLVLYTRNYLMEKEKNNVKNKR